MKNLFLDCTQTVRSGRNTFLFNFAAGRDEWVIPSGKMPSGLYIAVRPEDIFLLGISQSPGPPEISRYTGMNRFYRAEKSPLDCTRSTFRGDFSDWDKLVAQISRNFRKAPFLDRNRLISGSPLYSVRGGSEMRRMTPLRTEDRPKFPKRIL